jgi:transcriptional regulator with XRE-family HTH domain
MQAARKKALRKAFGQAVRALRIQVELTQEGLADEARLHRTYVGDLERGLKSPTLDVIVGLADALDVEPQALVESAFRLWKSTPQTEARGTPRQRFRKPTRQ